jgi:hypothetical protein
VDFMHLGVLHEEGVFWVTRSKESLSFKVVKRLPKGTDKRILSDELVVPRCCPIELSGESWKIGVLRSR